MDSQRGAANFTVQLPDNYINSLTQMHMESNDPDAAAPDVLHKDSKFQNIQLLNQRRHGLKN